MAKVDRVAEIIAEVQGSAADDGRLADRLVRVGRDAMNVTESHRVWWRLSFQEG